MKIMKLLICIVAISMFYGCSSPQPGQYSTVRAANTNQVDVPIELAWQKAMEALNNRWEIVSNDTVEKTLVVRTFYHDVKVSFTSLTENTTSFTVKSSEFMVKPNKAAVHTVYLELERALKALED